MCNSMGGCTACVTNQYFVNAADDCEDVCLAAGNMTEWDPLTETCVAARAFAFTRSSLTPTSCETFTISGMSNPANPIIPYSMSVFILQATNPYVSGTLEHSVFMQNLTIVSS